MLRYLAIGCGGLIVLGIVGFIALAIGMSVGGKGQSTDSTQKATPKKGTPSDSVQAALGETATLKDRTLVVNEAEQDYTPTNRFEQPKSGYEYVRTYVTLKNTGSKAFDYNLNNFKVQDSNGVQAPPESMSGLPYPLTYGSLASGGTLEGNMVFQVPQGDSNLSLIYQPYEKNVGTATVTLS